MFHDETQPENHLERPTQLPVENTPEDADLQRKRMLIALGILLAALVAVVVKDWDFWFPPPGDVQEATVRGKSRTAPPMAPATTPPPAASSREHKTTKAPAAAPAAAPPPFSATTERAVLPPLQVEVVAGNRHMNVPAKSSAIHVDVGTGATSTSASASASTQAAVRPDVSQQVAQNVTVSVPPDYPLLARQMKVQGAVSLQALISRDGSIQELQILSGPGILATAAREAVKQWHFKPYLQNGQPVETQARITVNFTISTN